MALKLSGVRNQTPHTLREFHDFAFAAKVEIDQIIARCCKIHRLSELQQGFTTGRGSAKPIHTLSRGVSADTTLSTHFAG